MNTTFISAGKERLRSGLNTLSTRASGLKTEGGATPYRILFGPIAGHRIYTDTPDQSFALGTYEWNVSTAIANQLEKGQTFYDIGANIGYDSLIAAKKVGQNGNIFAFEPGNINRKLLERNIALNGYNDQITVVSDGVGSESGVIFFAEYPTYGLVNHLITSENPAKPDAVIQEIPVVSIDDFAVHNPKPDLIKIDVEGAELAVIEGAERTLSESHPTIICEIREDVSEAIAKIMSRYGYQGRDLKGNGRGTTAGLRDILYKYQR